MKVAIIAPSINRPDFLLRQFEFFDHTNSPHPIYISDSSNPENAEKIKEGIKKFKNLKIIYRWDPPGKDCVYNLLPLVEEKYCIQVSDDDLAIPETISECAEFLEEHPDYGICSGKQVNFYFKKEDFNKTYGKIERQTLPLNESIEDENMLDRTQNLSSNPRPPFIYFAVRRMELEKEIRNLTRNFHPLGDMFEFLTLYMMIVFGKYKVLDRVGYIMQRSIPRFQEHGMMKDFLLFPSFLEEWKICESGFSELIHKKGIPKEKSIRMVRWIFMVLFANIYAAEINRPYLDQKGFANKSSFARKKPSQLKKLRRYLSKAPFLKSVYYKFNPPKDVSRPESKYYNDFKIVKDFLEQNR